MTNWTRCRIAFSGWLVDKSVLRKVMGAAANAIIRCTDRSHPKYKDYGGRGITVCEEWRNDLQLFVSYLLLLPNSGNVDLLIDRLDNDAGYSPGNLRWATTSESRVNKRSCFERSYSKSSSCSHLPYGRLRTEQGFQQRDLAEIAGVSIVTIKKFESGRKVSSSMFRTLDTVYRTLGDDNL